MTNPKYSSENITLLVPTKDRPEVLRLLLQSIKDQSIKPGCVLIVDGGKSVEHVTKDFKELRIQYERCIPPSQVRQKNHGLSKLSSSCSIVVFLDDDIVLENNAIEELLAFWNKTTENTAAVAMNITNVKPFSHNIFKRLFLMIGKNQGEVTISGCNTPISPVNNDIKSQWVIGGATSWKKDVVLRYVNKELTEGYAFAEDVNFSYPIGKSYDLYVCAGARVKHEHVSTKSLYTVFFGEKQIVDRMIFVLRNPDLSKIACLWSCIGVLHENIVRIFINREIGYMFRFIGNVKGLYRAVILAVLIKQQDQGRETI